MNLLFLILKSFSLNYFPSYPNIVWKSLLDKKALNNFWQNPDNFKTKIWTIDWLSKRKHCSNAFERVWRRIAKKCFFFRTNEAHPHAKKNNIPILRSFKYIFSSNTFFAFRFIEKTFCSFWVCLRDPGIFGFSSLIFLIS